MEEKEEKFSNVSDISDDVRVDYLGDWAERKSENDRNRRVYSEHGLGEQMSLV